MLIKIDPWDPQCGVVINNAEIATITRDNFPYWAGSSNLSGPRTTKNHKDWLHSNKAIEGNFARVTLRNSGGMFLVALSEKATLEELHLYLANPLICSVTKE